MKELLNQRKIINTYILTIKSNHYMIDDIDIKIYELQNGEFYKVTKGKLIKISNEDVERLLQ